MKSRLLSLKVLAILDQAYKYINEGATEGSALVCAVYDIVPELFETKPLIIIGPNKDRINNMMAELSQVDYNKYIDVPDLIRVCKRLGLWSATMAKAEPDEYLLTARCNYLDGSNFVLPKLTRNITKLALARELDPLYGRTSEINEVIQVLMQRNKANPILVGAAGVGKTAIIEGLAQRIIENKVHEQLHGHVILELSPARLLARSGNGPSETADIVQQIVYECSTTPWLILFVDEVHSIFSSKAQQLVDIANILKPALARRDIRMIGATTPTEYANSIEVDHALERRVQRINVGELPFEEVVGLAEYVAPTYEKYHQVQMPREMTKDLVKYSSFFLPHHCQPDTVLTFMDALMAKSRLMDQPRINDAILAAVLSKSENPFLSAAVTKKTERLDEIKVYLTNTFKSCSKTTESILKQGAVCAYRKPVATVLVKNGNPGLAAVYAEELSNTLYGRNTVIYYDMQEFHDPATMNRWLGSPSGYIGFDRGGSLITQLNAHNNPILILDNLDEAHPTILNLVQGMLTTGYVTDTLGRVAYLTSTIIIGTIKDRSAVGVNTIGFNTDKPAAAAPKPDKDIMPGFAEVDTWKKDTEESVVSYLRNKRPAIDEKEAKKLAEETKYNIAVLVAKLKVN